MAIGAYAVERDYSHYIAQASRTVLAVIGTASKGPVGEAVAITSTQDLVSKFGPLKVDYYGLYTSQYFLSQSSKLYYVRAAGESVAPSKASITGINAESDDVSDAIVLEMIEKGTYSNGYKVIVSNSETEYLYDILLKNTSGVTIEKISEVSLEDLVEGYKTSNFNIVTRDLTITSLTAGEYTFDGGDDGISDIKPADYNLAADALRAETVDINLIAVPGISEAAVVNEVLTIAENRGDCLYIIDPPKGLTRDGCIQWVNGGGAYEHTKFNSSCGAVYYDWIQIYDSVNKQYVQVPPSVSVCATYAYNDRVSDVWYAPAGLTRGIIRGVITPITRLTRADVELLYENNINSIYEDPQVGNVVWGQKTLWREDTALNRINVRRLMNYLKKVITAACQYLVFEPNDRVTWNSFEMKVLPTLNNVKNRRGLYEYKVVKGESIVTSEDIDNYKMPCMILIRPTKAAEEIPIYFVITNTGADFNEVLEVNGVV